MKVVCRDALTVPVRLLSPRRSSAYLWATFCPEGRLKRLREAGKGFLAEDTHCRYNNG
jgi:hypothetical protein